MTLVDQHQPVVGIVAPDAGLAGESVAEVVEEAEGADAGKPSVEVPGVVLHPRAVPDLLDHLEVVAGSAEQPLRLEQLALALESLDPLDQFASNRGEGGGLVILGHDVVHRGEHEHAVFVGELLAGEGIEQLERLHLVAPEIDPDRELLVGGIDLDAVPLDPELSTDGIDLVPHVLHVGEGEEELAAVDGPALLDHDRLLRVFGRRTEAVEARHARDHDHVPAAEEAAGRGETEPVEIVVPRGVLLDVDVPGRDVRLGLVVVVVGDEVRDRVLREEFAKLLEQLGRERLVVADDQRGPTHAFDHVGHGERLAGAGRPEQDLFATTLVDAVHQLLDRLRLVTGGRELALQLEGSGHGHMLGRPGRHRRHVSRRDHRRAAPGAIACEARGSRAGPRPARRRGRTANRRWSG